MLNVKEGRPADSAARSEHETAVYDFLDGLGISYRRVDHAPAHTMEDCREAEEALGITVCKNLLLANRQGTAHYLLLMPGDKPFRTKTLSAEIGSARLSFDTPENLARLLGTYPGAASILGLIYDREKEVQLLIDRDLLGEEFLGAHPLENTTSLALRLSDILDVFLPAVGHRPMFVSLPVGEES